MACPPRKINETYEDYCARRKKEAVFTKRALVPKAITGDVYVGSPPIYTKAFDKNGQFLIPVQWIKAQKGVPYRRGPGHPKVMAA